MEYLLGSVVSVLAMVIGRSVLASSQSYSLPIPIVKATQSRSYQLLAPLRGLTSYLYNEEPSRQSRDYHDRTSVRVVFTSDKAYWIYGNTLYVAEIGEDGSVDSSTQSAVDTMALDSVELEEMSYIVEKLTEGKRNDSGSSGDSQF